MARQKIIGLRVDISTWKRYQRLRSQWRALAHKYDLDEPNYSDDMRGHLEYVLQNWEGRYYDTVEHLEQYEKVVEELKNL